MRDNWNIDELSDQAWTKMKTMLDQEMPVQTGARRPLASWWRSAAAVLLLLALGFWVFQMKDGQDRRAQNLEVVKSNESPNRSDRPEPDIGTGTAAVAEPNGREGEIPATAQTGTTNSADVEAMNNQQQNKTLHRKETPTLQTIEREVAVTTSEPNETTEAAPKPIDQNKIIAAGPEDASSAEEEPVKSTVIDAPAKERLSTPFNLEPLYSRTANLLEPKPLPLGEINPYTPKKSVLTPLEINAGVIGDLQNGNFSGLLAEARSGLNLHTTGDWSLQLGAGLHGSKKPFQVRFVESGTVAEADAGQDQQGITYDPSSNAVGISRAVQNSQVYLQSTYVDVPVLLGWRFSRRWSVAAGGRLSWLVSSAWSSNRDVLNSGSGNNMGFALSLDNSSNKFTVYEAVSNRAPTTFQLRDFYSSGTLGLTFRPHRAWHLRLQYQHSISNLLDSEAYRESDRSLWLSAGFRF